MWWQTRCRDLLPSQFQLVAGPPSAGQVEDILPARAGRGATCGTQAGQVAVVAEDLPARAGRGATCGTQAGQLKDTLPARAGRGATCGTQAGQVDVVAASKVLLNWKEIAPHQEVCPATWKAMSLLFCSWSSGT